MASEQKLAGLGTRLLAFLTDFLIIVLVVIGVFISVPYYSEPVRQLINFLINVLAIALYFGFSITNLEGTTPGQKLLGIKVVQEDGKSPSRIAATKRLFVKSIFMLPLPLGVIVRSLLTILVPLGAIDSLLIIMGKNKQTVHDKIAHTLVIKVDNDPRHLTKTILVTLLSLLAILGLVIASVAKHMS